MNRSISSFRILFIIAAVGAAVSSSCKRVGDGSAHSVRPATVASAMTTRERAGSFRSLPAPEPPPLVPAPAGPLARMEREVLRWSNVERISRGLRPLVWSSRLALAARRHSDEMGRLGYFSHSSPNQATRSVMDRVRLVGVRSRPLIVGENIGMSSPRPKQAKEFVRDWMESPGHRDNLLGRTYRYIGVGVAYRDGSYIATQVFSSAAR